MKLDAAIAEASAIGVIHQPLNFRLESLFTTAIESVGLVGATFGFSGFTFGGKVQNEAARFFPVYQPGIPALFQRPNSTSTLIGVSAGSAVQGASSRFRLFCRSLWGFFSLR